MLHSILKERDKQYYIVGLSLPFEDLTTVAIRYAQTAFALERAQGTPGVYHSVDYAFDYLLSQMGEQSRREAMTHPAIATLRRHDAQRQTELCETLYQYLLHERSLLLGAEAMHIHRNSFMYRLGRIKDLIGVDFDDPQTRAYLLFSFLIEKSQSDIQTKKI